MRDKRAWYGVLRKLFGVNERYIPLATGSLYKLFGVNERYIPLATGSLYKLSRPMSRRLRRSLLKVYPFPFTWCFAVGLILTVLDIFLKEFARVRDTPGC